MKSKTVQSEAPTAVAVQRVVLQRVVITLSDTPEKTVKCKVDFKPSVKASAKMTPAIQAAMDMLEALKQKSLENAPHEPRRE